MSKLYNKYLELKNEDKNTILLFKSGMFYIFLDKDAELINKLLHLKLTKLNEKVVKCGFPATHLDKYVKMVKITGNNIKIIDDATNTKKNNYLLNNELNKFIDNFLQKDLDFVSVSEAYTLLYDIQEFFKKIKDKENL